MKLKTMLATTGLFMKKKAPYIWFGVGVVSSVGAIYSTYKATMKLEAILDEHDFEKAKILDEYNDDEDWLYDQDEMPENERAEKLLAFQEERDIALKKLGRGTFFKICRNYAAPAALEVLSLGSFGMSLGEAMGLYLTAAGALSELSATFDDYRSNVREDLGEGKDYEYYYGVKPEKVESVETNPETGKTKKVKKDMLVGIPKGEFAFRYEKSDYETGLGSSQWDPSQVYNATWINHTIGQFQQELDNNIMKKVYMSDILRELGYSKKIYNTPKNRIAGYKHGDIIECGLEKVYQTLFQDVHDFVIGASADVTLRFNPRRDVDNLTGTFTNDQIDAVDEAVHGSDEVIDMKEDVA